MSASFIDLMSNNIIFAVPISIVTGAVFMDIVLNVFTGVSIRRGVNVLSEFELGVEATEILNRGKLSPSIWWGLVMTLFSINAFAVLSVKLHDYGIHPSLITDISVFLVASSLALIEISLISLTISKLNEHKIEAGDNIIRKFIGYQCVVNSHVIDNEIEGECEVADADGNRHYFKAKSANSEMLRKGDTALIKKELCGVAYIEKID